MSDPAEQVLRVRLEQDEQWPPYDCEEVLGRQVGPGRYRVASPPAFAKRLSVGDVVRVHADESGRLWIDAVVEQGRHSTVRVMLVRPEAERQLTAALTAHGCRLTSSQLPALRIVDVPEAADYLAVRQALEAGERQGDWEFQEAAVSLHHEPAI